MLARIYVFHPNQSFQTYFQEENGQIVFDKIVFKIQHVFLFREKLHYRGTTTGYKSSL